MEQHILDELVQGIREALGSRVYRIILYGSVARGTDSQESDVDIAIIMEGTLDNDYDDVLSDFIVDMDLKYDRVFSIADIDQKKFQKWKDAMPFYQSIEREGVVLWKAA